jgi:hypothetical protein
MSFLNFLTSMFASPGTSAYGDSNQNKLNLQNYASNFLGRIKPLLGTQAGFAGQQEPGRERSVLGQMQAGTPGGAYSAVQAGRQGFMGQAQAGLPAMLQRLLAGGAGIGATQGAGLNATNSAMRQGNDLAGYSAGPAGVAARGNLTASATANPMPGMNILQQLASLIYGNNQPAPGPSPLGSALGMIAQMFTGGA